MDEVRQEEILKSRGSSSDEMVPKHTHTHKHARAHAHTHTRTHALMVPTHARWCHT